MKPHLEERKEIVKVLKKSSLERMTVTPVSETQRRRRDNACLGK